TLGGGGGGGALVPPPLAHAAAHRANARINVKTPPWPWDRIAGWSEHARSPGDSFPIWNCSVSLWHRPSTLPPANSFSSPRRTVDTTSHMHNHCRNAPRRRAATRKELFLGHGIYLPVCVSRDSQRAARLLSWKRIRLSDLGGPEDHVSAGDLYRPRGRARMGAHHRARPDRHGRICRGEDAVVPGPRRGRKPGGSTPRHSSGRSRTGGVTGPPGPLTAGFAPFASRRSLSGIPPSVC